MTHPRTLARVLARGLAVLGLVAGLALTAATAAQAHNVLLKTDPPTNGTVATLPSTVVLTFNLPALNIGAAMQIVGPDGDVADGKPSLVNTTVSEAVKPGSPPGAYNVTWRITSADGHPISGTFAFTAKAASSGTAAPGPSLTVQPGGPVIEAQHPSTPAKSSSHGVLIVVIVVVVIVLIGIVLVALLAARRRREEADSHSGAGTP